LENHTSEDVDRIGIDLEDNTSLHPHSHNTSQDSDSIATISTLSQCRHSHQPNNGTVFLVPSPAQDSDLTGAISALSECHPAQPSVLHRHAEHSGSIHNAPLSVVQ
jgi:hypothetical protein